MTTPIDDPIVRKKHEVQKALFERANGDFKKYNETVHKIMEEVRAEHPGGFKTADPRIHETAENG